MRRQRFLVPLLIALSAQVTAAAEAGCPDSANKFWKTFRQVVLKGDKRRIASYVHFPFEMRGALDSSGVRRVSRDDFPAKLSLLTKADPGMLPTPSTMAELVRSTPELQPRSCSPEGNEFRVGAWQFELMPQGWRFVRAYVGD